MECHGDRAEPLIGPRVEPIDIIRVGDVGSHEQAVHFIGNGLARKLIDIGHYHVCSFSGKASHRCCTDAAGSSGHDRDTVGQTL